VRPRRRPRTPHRSAASRSTSATGLACSKWRTICNGKTGKIHADVRTVPGTTAPALYGMLSYGKRLSCGVYCQVDGSVDAPDMLFCQFNCPGNAAAVQVSFTAGRTVCS
jgi:hypothetical protein